MTLPVVTYIVEVFRYQYFQTSLFWVLSRKCTQCIEKS